MEKILRIFGLITLTLIFIGLFPSVLFYSLGLTHGLIGKWAYVVAGIMLLLLIAGYVKAFKWLIKKKAVPKAGYTSASLSTKKKLVGMYIYAVSFIIVPLATSLFLIGGFELESSQIKWNIFIKILSFLYVFGFFIAGIDLLTFKDFWVRKWTVFMSITGILWTSLVGYKILYALYGPWSDLSLEGLMILKVVGLIMTTLPVSATIGYYISVAFYFTSPKVRSSLNDDLLSKTSDNTA